MIDRSYHNWPVVFWNVSKACQVWIRLGKLLQREGADHLVSAMYNQAVVQAVLLFGAKTWVLLAAMSKNMEGVHVVFLKHDTGKKSNKKKAGIWSY